MVAVIEAIYRFLWGDLITIPLPGGNSLGLSLLVILLIPTGIYFTIRTRVLPIRMFPDMVRALRAKKEQKEPKEHKGQKSSLSTLQTLVVSTATRVGMGNLVGVVAAVSAGGAGADEGASEGALEPDKFSAYLSGTGNLYGPEGTVSGLPAAGMV